MNSLKYLWVYSAANENVVAWHNKLIKSRREMGYDIEGFCCTPKYLNNRHWLPFPELDRLWKIGYPPLIKMYEELIEATKGRNVFIHYNGANIHPEIIQKIKMFKVYTAGDDPESTEILTKPVAKYYDLQLINNIACIDMYKSWGLENVFFWPLGSIAFPDEINLCENDIKNIETRPYRTMYVGEVNHWKKDFFCTLTSTFPDTECWGKGWPNGYISDEEMSLLYRASQIGVNVHNSTGPINFRTYELPAYGIMQICDNKDNLDKIFELNHEVIGFNSTQECMEKIEYYLSNPLEQREIALAGWSRWKMDYTPIAVWEKLVKYVETYYRCSQREEYAELEKLLVSQSGKYAWGKFSNFFVNLKRRL